MDNNEYNRTEGQQTDYSQYYNTENYNYGNTQNQYNSQQYKDMSGVRVDSEGRPMKNRFAVQLVFAIVEILLCCINPVAMVLAIIALVFAIQANTAYVHNEEINFKVKSKVSNILLIIGGVWATISLITTILLSALFMTSVDAIMREFEREYNGDMEAFLEDFLEGYELYDDGYESDFLPAMKSDIIISDKETKDTLIIDAKFYTKSMSNGKYGESIKLHSYNLYQIYTYVKNEQFYSSGKVSGILLYAKTDEDITPNGTYSFDNSKIMAKSLDLNQDFEDIKLFLNSIIENWR